MREFARFAVLSLSALAALSLLAAAGYAQEQLDLGGQAPGFALVDAATGETVTMKPDDGKLKVVVFTSNQCPFATAFEPRLIELANRFRHRGVRFYAVNPNDDSQDAAETLATMKARAETMEYPFPYVKDGDGSIARAYGARVTPHVFLVDGTGAVRYRGSIDDSPKPAERKTEGLINALTALSNGREIGTPDTRAFGCTIQWAKATK